MKIAIAGYGLEGEANYRYWASDPTNEVTIVDQRQPDHDIPQFAKLFVGQDAFEHLDGFDMVIRTAGLPPSKIKTDGKIWSGTNEFFAQCPAPIIGVTGSKGKGTTASLIVAMFEASGKKVWLVGNIGIPAIDVLEQVGSEDIVVFELSSFQLWDLKRSPQTAVVLLIEPDHLNVHDGMDDYVNAKGSIRRYQGDNDICIYHPTNQYARHIVELSTAGKVQRYGVPDDGGVYERSGSFLQGNQVICSTSKLQLLGAHNVDNACAAITVARHYGLSIDAIERGLQSFTGLPHRLKFVREAHGVRYYDDSIATTPSSAIAALRSFNQSKVIILGGSSKGSDYSVLADELLDHSVHAILIGDVAAEIASECNKVGFKDYEIIDNATMPTIVGRASELASSGGVVLLSPSSASFGLFKDYADRGEQFIAAVNAL